MYAKTDEGYPINLPDSINGYKIKKHIGSGGTSVVFLVEDENNGQLFSAKIIPKLYVQSKKLMGQIENEISVLSKINHPNIIRFYKSFEYTDLFNESYIILILEYCENKDLYDLIENLGFKDENQKQKIIRGILDAVKYLHGKGIAHGDIKPENILLDSNFNPKLSDFGYCKTSILAGNESKSGTLYYAAPELFVEGEFNTLKADIWSIGILLYALSEESFPFSSGNQQLIIRQIITGQLTFNPGISDKLKNVVNKCTQHEAENRPSIEELINDEYFYSYDKLDEFLIQDDIDPFSLDDEPFYSKIGFELSDELSLLVF